MTKEYSLGWLLRFYLASNLDGWFILSVCIVLHPKYSSWFEKLHHHLSFHYSLDGNEYITTMNHPPLIPWSCRDCFCFRITFFDTPFFTRLNFIMWGLFNDYKIDCSRAAFLITCFEITLMKYQIINLHSAQSLVSHIYSLVDLPETTLPYLLHPLDQV